MNQILPSTQTQNIPELNDELKHKLDNLKLKLDKFSSEIVKEHKEIIGVSVLPPSKPYPGEKLTEKEVEELTKKINLLIVIKVLEQKEGYVLRDKIAKAISKKASDFDKDLNPVVLDIIELREDCFDGKYEIIEMIAQGLALYDPKDLLAAIKISQIHQNMVLKKFDKYIVSYIAVGSLFRGDATSHDIDVSIVVDDTDVKKMTRVELKDKLGAIIRGMGFDASKITGVKKEFHIQTYILTDFWDAIKDANPVIYTFLRDGVPFFDRGVFMPWKLLLKMGRIRPSPEAIDMQMDVGERLIQRTKGKMLNIIGEDLHYAILNPAQAALMLYGVAPPTPAETIKLMDEIFVKKEKLLEPKYIKILENVRKYYKGIEHGEIKTVSGKDIDNLLRDAEDYMKRINKLFDQIQKTRDKENINELTKNCLSILEDALKLQNVKFSKEKAAQLLKKHFVDTKIIHQTYLDIFKDILKLKDNYTKKKINHAELEKLNREGRVFIKTFIEYIQRKKGYELDRAKIRFKYGNQAGEMLVLAKEAFIFTENEKKEKEIQKASVDEYGALVNITKSSSEEFEKALVSVQNIGPIFVKQKTFDSLKKLFGFDLQILMG